jgi:hypothetical protein
MKSNMRRLAYPLLNRPELNIEDLLQLVAPQWMKHNQFIDAVHEFWRKSTLRCFGSGAHYFLVQ